MYPVAFKGNLIATNLPSDFTGEQLAELFEGYGMVIGAEIRYIPAVAGTATIGVIALAPESAVERAIEAINLSTVGGRQIKVGRAKQRPQKPKPAALPRKAASAAQPAAATAFPAQAAQPSRTVVVEYKPRRRLLSNA
jgi:RNA recognition motif-containing protein